MTRYISILFFLLLVPAIFMNAQHSAQATMRVSVRVLSGASVEVNQPPLVKLSQGHSTELATLASFGAKGNTLINIPKLVMLNNLKGHKIDLDIEGQKEGDNYIRFRGSSEERMFKGRYYGELKTIVEYI